MLVVGYLRIMPPTVGCYPTFPIARGDVPYLDNLERQLTAMLADQAFHHGAVFVDSELDVPEGAVVVLSAHCVAPSVYANSSTRQLQVLDATAFALCRDQKLPIRVFSIFKSGALKRVMQGEDEGTLVHV